MGWTDRHERYFLRKLSKRAVLYTEMINAGAPATGPNRDGGEFGVSLFHSPGASVTGATVRVTESGLGCSEWPRCTPDSFVPVNTGHAATAYFGRQAGITKISDVLADAQVRSQVEAVLAETKELLVAKFGFAPEVQQAYVEKIITRFTNPHLPDTVERVGRAPLRKISRTERFVGPAAELAERGLSADALVAAVAAALAFDVPEDPESAELQARLAAARGDRQATDALVTDLTGIAEEHPLFPALSEVFAAA